MRKPNVLMHNKMMYFQIFSQQSQKWNPNNPSESQVNMNQKNLKILNQKSEQQIKELMNMKINFHHLIINKLYCKHNFKLFKIPNVNTRKEFLLQNREF